MVSHAHHTWASRTAVGLLLVLAALQLWWARSADPGDLSSARLLFPITIIGALFLARGNSFETRLAAVLASGAQVFVAVLAIVFGLPGQARDTLDAATLASLLLPLAVVVLIAIDRKGRRSGSSGSPQPPAHAPYAR